MLQRVLSILLYPTRLRLWKRKLTFEEMVYTGPELPPPTRWLPVEGQDDEKAPWGRDTRRPCTPELVSDRPPPRGPVIVRMPTQIAFPTGETFVLGEKIASGYDGTVLDAHLVADADESPAARFARTSSSTASCSKRPSSSWSHTLSAPPGRVCACKVVFIGEGRTNADVSAVKAEIGMLKANNITSPLLGEVLFVGRDDYMVYLLMPKYTTTLDVVLRSRWKKHEPPTPLPFEQLCLELMGAIHHLHIRNVAHLDIKPQNIALDTPSMHVRLIDFGHSQPYDNEKTYDRPISFTQPYPGGGRRPLRDPIISRRWNEVDPLENKVRCAIFTTTYAAPEVLRRGIFDGVKADVYSFGVVLWEMVINGKPRVLKPDQGGAVYDLHNEDSIAELSEETKDLLFNQILVDDPFQRISLDDLAYHPYFYTQGTTSYTELYERATNDALLHRTLNKEQLFTDKRDFQVPVALQGNALPGVLVSSERPVDDIP